MLGRWLWLLWAGRTGKEIRGDFRWGLHQWSKLRHWPRKCPRDAKVVKMGTDYQARRLCGPCSYKLVSPKYLPSASQDGPHVEWGSGYHAYLRSRPASWPL
jgi:hypothetical protein